MPSVGGDPIPDSLDTGTGGAECFRELFGEFGEEKDVGIG